VQYRLEIGLETSKSWLRYIALQMVYIWYVRNRKLTPPPADISVSANIAHFISVNKKGRTHIGPFFYVLVGSRGFGSLLAELESYLAK